MVKSTSDSDNKHEHPLQAVLLADTFSNAWHPITLESHNGTQRPLSLCPLNNVPLLRHSIDFLQGAGVQELFLLCTSGHDALELTLPKFQYSKLSITLLRFSDCTSIGDALRELDRRNVVKSDPFILMQGDVVTNVDLKLVLEIHSERRKRDAGAIMTVLLEDEEGWGPRRSSRDDLVLGLDTTGGMDEARILLWDSDPEKEEVSIPTSFFVENSSNIMLTRNYLDCGLDICSPDVLARFSDEFDYRELRSQFVANCVSEEEIGLQSRIFAYVLRRGEYAGRPLGDMRRYHDVSMDLLKRWCYPLVPDNYHNTGRDASDGSNGHGVVNYICERHYIYRAVGKVNNSNVRSHVGRSTKLLGPLLLGPNNHIGEHCHLQRSTFGPNCRVLDHCRVVDSHLWCNVLVEEGAILNGVIACEGSIVRRGAVVERGCVIGKGCVVGAGVTLPEFTRITMAVEVEEDDDYSGFDECFNDEDELSDEEKDDCGKDRHAVNTSDAGVLVDNVTNHSVVGKNGIGRVWTPPTSDEYNSDDDEEESNTDALELMKSQSIGFDMSLLYRKWKQSQADEEDNLSEECIDSNAGNDDSDIDGEWKNEDISDSNFQNAGASNLDEEGIQITGRQKGVDVVKELRDICLEHETSSPVENLRIELNSFKFSQNATYSDCCKGAMMAVLEKIVEESDFPSPGKLVSLLKKELEYWAPLFQSICMGSEEEKAIIHALETMALNTGKPTTVLGNEPAFRFVLQTLHDREIVNEEAIFEWASERKNEGMDTPQGELFFQRPTQDFLEWLEAESNDEGSEDDSD